MPADVNNFIGIFPKRQAYFLRLYMMVCWALRHDSSRSGSGAALHLHTAILSQLLGLISPGSLRSIPARKPWVSPCASTLVYSHQTKTCLSLLRDRPCASCYIHLAGN